MSGVGGRNYARLTHANLSVCALSVLVRVRRRVSSSSTCLPPFPLKEVSRAVTNAVKQQPRARGLPPHPAPELKQWQNATQRSTGGGGAVHVILMENSHSLWGWSIFSGARCASKQGCWKLQNRNPPTSAPQKHCPPPSWAAPIYELLLLSDATLGKEHSAPFPLSPAPSLPCPLPKTHRPRSQDSRLRGRNGQYGISLPSVNLLSPLIFSSIFLLCSCFSGSLLPLAAYPPFPPCALNTNILSLLPACTVRPVLKTHWCMWGVCRECVWDRQGGVGGVGARKSASRAHGWIGKPWIVFGLIRAVIR